jgi:tRNA pseudouridine55 synthase
MTTIALGDTFVLGLKDFHERPTSILPLLNEREGGLLLLDKPYTFTSFNGVHRVRKLLTEYSGERKIKVGHGGTLDPLATGLLIIATRKATKKLHLLLHESKTYEVTVRLGITSPSFDLETPVSVVSELSQLSETALREAILAMKGDHEQIPPIFSAVKIKGRPVYMQARKGRTPELAAKSISISDVTIINISIPLATFAVTCSKGTYVRSLARDLGDKLGVGAIVTELRRTQIGAFSVDNALSFDMLEELRSLLKQPEATVSA